MEVKKKIRQRIIMQLLKKTSSYLLVIVLLFSVLCVGSPVETSAVSIPQGYPNTYTNTGSGPTDIIGVARTQIGYQENSAGTKYGYWYNKIFATQPWCAMFVSWCAEQANIPNTVIQKYASCSSEVAWFKSIGRWHDSKYYGGSYTPKKGDVVFFRDAGSASVSTHTGVLAGLNGNYLVTIEGNATNAKVCEYTTNSSRTLTSSYVIGYGNPNYSDEVEEEPDDCEKWQVTADALTVRKSASTSSSKLTTIPYGTVVDVTEFEMAGGYLWGKITYSKKTGWIALNYCDYIYGSINGEYYQLEPSISPTSVTLYTGDTKKLSGTNILGATYSSTDKTVAKVSKAGKITAVSEGSAKIKCTTKTGSAVCKVTVKGPYLNVTEATICLEEKLTLSVTGTKDEITWSSSNKKIAKVSKAGKVTPVSAGKATITAKAGETELKCEVTVTKEPTAYENFTVTSKTNLYEKPTTSSSKLVSVPKEAAFKIKEIEYTSTYTWGKAEYSGKTGWLALNKCKYINGTIDGKKLLAPPFLKKASKNIYLKETYGVVVRFTDDKVTYTSNKPEIASVDEDGVVTANQAGTAKITVKTGDTKLKFTAKVINPTISKAKLTMLPSAEQTLTIRGGDGKITWKSSKKSVATINAEGVVTAVKYGTATITAKRNGIKLTCTVNVYDPVLSKEKLTLKKGVKTTLTVYKSSGAAVKWATSDKKIVKLNQKGVIKGVSKGKAKVTAKVDGKKMTCVVTVK